MVYGWRLEVFDAWERGRKFNPVQVGFHYGGRINCRVVYLFVHVSSI